jgi:hypothetical protein
MNLPFCDKYIVWTGAAISGINNLTTYINGHWKIVMLLNTLHFNKNVVPMFGQES